MSTSPLSPASNASALFAPVSIIHRNETESRATENRIYMNVLLTSMRDRQIAHYAKIEAYIEDSSHQMDMTTLSSIINDPVSCAHFMCLLFLVGSIDLSKEKMNRQERLFAEELMDRIEGFTCGVLPRKATVKMPDLEHCFIL